MRWAVARSAAGDFHAALNFAATLEVPLLFFCRNNGYAISTPTEDQYRGDGIAARAAGYGMLVVRVDGNDLLAVRRVVAEARALSLALSRPVLVEAMTYRQGHHSTSDDSTRYRSVTEIKRWQELYDPATRFRLFMQQQGWWSDEQERTLRDQERFAVLRALETAERRAKPPLHEMFEDVYHTKPPHILRQEAELHAHVAKYPDHYHHSAH
jgi:2-oxoisovalerate dehydrogenase E1 component alpha subunit